MQLVREEKGGGVAVPRVLSWQDVLNLCSPAQLWWPLCQKLTLKWGVFVAADWQKAALRLPAEWDGERMRALVTCLLITTIAQKPRSPSEWASRLLVCTCTYTHAHSLGTSEGDVQTILHHCANDHSKSALACVSVERARAKVRDKAGEVPQIGSFVTANWDFLWVSYAV